MTVRPEIRQTTPSWGHLNVINTSENMLSGVYHQSFWPNPWLMHQKVQVTHFNPQQHTDRQTLTQMCVNVLLLLHLLTKTFRAVYLDSLLRILNACQWCLRMLYKLAGQSVFKTQSISDFKEHESINQRTKTQATLTTYNHRSRTRRKSHEKKKSNVFFLMLVTNVKNIYIIFYKNFNDSVNII